MSNVYRVQGIATIFGLDYDGKADRGDNGLGFFTDPGTNKPYDTTDKTLMGCSLPIPVIDKSIGLHSHPDVRQAISNQEFTVWITARNNRSVRCKIVDIGPSVWTKHIIDLCYSPAHILDTKGYALVDLEIRDKANNPLPIEGWEICGGSPGPNAGQQHI